MSYMYDTDDDKLLNLISLNNVDNYQDELNYES